MLCYSLIVALVVHGDAEGLQVGVAGGGGDQPVHVVHGLLVAGNHDVQGDRGGVLVVQIVLCQLPLQPPLAPSPQILDPDNHHDAAEQEEDDNDHHAIPGHPRDVFFFYFFVR